MAATPRPGGIILVRYADDIVAGFEHKADAERFLAAMKERLAGFALTLHPDKTRLIEFGRFAAANRKRRGGKPETFDFLGFTHICGALDVALFASAEDRGATGCGPSCVRSRRNSGAHARVHPRTGKWLKRVVAGWYNYHAVPTNIAALSASASCRRTLERALRRRSQKDRTTWRRMRRSPSGCQRRASSIRGRARASPSDTQGGSRMP